LTARDRTPPRRPNTGTTTDTGTTTEPAATTEPAGGAGVAGDTLPDDLKATRRSARYADVPALAKAHIEAHKVAKSKLICFPAKARPPRIGARCGTRSAVREAPTSYDVPMPELRSTRPTSMRAALKESYAPFRELAHEIGLTRRRRRRSASSSSSAVNATISKGASTRSTALKQQLGADYAPKLKGAGRRSRGSSAPTRRLLARRRARPRRSAARRLIKGMMRLAEIAAEHRIIEADTSRASARSRTPRRS
jgi:hypothetical protein